MARRKKKEIKNIILDIYRDLYANSEPKADFDELCDNAEIDSEGRKVIDFMAYEIDGELMKDIIDKHCKQNKLKERDINSVNVNVYLGCSPKTKEGTVKYG